MKAFLQKMIEGYYLFRVIWNARNIQSLLWGDANGEWGMEEWRRMFQKRWEKIYNIKPDNPHAIIELRKRLLQNAALCIALLAILSFYKVKDINKTIETNLKEYAKEEQYDI